MIFILYWEIVIGIFSIGIPRDYSIDSGNLYIYIYIYIYIYQFHMEIKYYSDIFGIIYDLLEIDIGLSKQLSW